MKVTGVLRCGVAPDLSPDDRLPEHVKASLMLLFGVSGRLIVCSSVGVQIQRVNQDDDLRPNLILESSSHVVVMAVRTHTSDIVVNQTFPDHWYELDRAKKLLAYRERLAETWESVITERLSRVNPEGPTLEDLQATYTRVERQLSESPRVEASAIVITHWLTCRPDGEVVDHEVIWHDRVEASVAIVLSFPRNSQEPLYFSTFPVKIEAVP